MKVLILTIQEDPPSLDSYLDDEDDIVDEDFSRSFTQFVEVLLQKNPARRPTTRELLNKHFANMNREAARDKMRDQVCAIVEDVGNSDSVRQALPGHTPVSIVLSQEQDRPPGTTWVFADGSQILSSSATTKHTVDDVMAELDEFEKLTGGEHYDRTRSAGNKSSNQHHQGDDLSAFMDEFEQNTAGEDFRRNKS